ncbi:MAG TPA: general stress protein [Ktedonobacteraceae bacterium]|jgi:general stress protein YciG|nr:general stress protein [Ktedonobacteraceae bacterium]
MEEPTQKRRRPGGFASLSPERRTQIARIGGLAAQRLGRAHQWTSEEAQEAGRKAGRMRRAQREGVRNAADV